MELTEKINLIINSSHSNPFDVLGPHLVAVNGVDAITIRTFQPNANDVTIIDLRKDNTNCIKVLADGEGTVDLCKDNTNSNCIKTLADGAGTIDLCKDNIKPAPDMMKKDTAKKTSRESANTMKKGAAPNNEYPMVMTRKDGFFEIVFKETSAPFPYKLKVTKIDGTIETFYDPYCFGQVLTEYDLHLMGEGTHYKKYEKLGAHVMTIDNVKGVYFALWAPNAMRVSIKGDFNGWDSRTHTMRLLGNTGIWELFIPGLKDGTIYKFEIRAKYKDYTVEKSDPYGFYSELRPKSASVVFDINKYTWGDDDWIKARKEKDWLASPISMYEVHLGSWKRIPEEGNRFMTYREMAANLLPYVKELGYTHLQLMPVSEHPLDESWGYQVLGYFAATSRFGTPDDFMYLVDRCHQEGIGVIMDWVPAHFPKDGHGLAHFDGTALYEHEDPRRGEHRDWGTLIFNYGRKEVANFLISNALFWLDKYHLDGLRVDAVASMLYLDYSKKPGDWIPNQYGGNENLEAVAFLKWFNEVVHGYHPGVLTIAEESTSWAMVSRPTYIGGLGFSMKWNMGWMHDILTYFSKDPIYRKYHHNNLTFALLYAFTENFVNVFSHDEVVYGKCSMINKMPGDNWQKFANLRLLYAYMYAQPGKKLLFMGGEFGQYCEWVSTQSLDWHLTEYEPHQKLLRWVKELNRLYAAEPALYEVDFHHEGFEWVDFTDYASGTVAFIRKAKDHKNYILCAFNFTPTPRLNYRIGVPYEGFYQEILNSDSEVYWGSNVGNWGGFHSDPIWWQGRPHSLNLNLPPLGAVFFKLANKNQNQEIINGGNKDDQKSH